MITVFARGHPHDKFFKLWLGDIETARGFLAAHLSNELLNTLDLKTLKSEKEMFAGQVQGVADLLFSVRRKDRRLAYILLEHKSYPDKHLSWQMHKYIYAVVERHRQIRRRMKRQEQSDKTNEIDDDYPCVYAFCVYHGVQSFPHPVHPYAVFNDPSGEMERIAHEGFRVIDTNSFSDKKLMAQDWHSLNLFVHKHVYDADLLEHLETVSHLIDEAIAAGRGDGVQAMLEYIGQVNEHVSLKSLEELMERYMPQSEGENIMTPAKQWYMQGVTAGIEQGRLEGRNEGRNEGRLEERQVMVKALLASGMSAEEASRVSGLSFEALNDICMDQAVDSVETETVD